MRFHVTLAVHGVVLGLRDMCAFMLPLTVHGVVSGIRDVHFCDLLVQTFRSIELIAD